jgi:uncharacterized protein
MKIGVVADTHSRPLPRQMVRDFKNMDAIIHAGDFCHLEDLKKFEELKEVNGVYGNMDDGTIRRLFPRRQILKFDAVAVGLFHGEGPPQKIVDVVKNEFRDDNVNVIVFGHSHQPLNEKINNVIFFNPGSPNDTIFAPYCSYGVLEIMGGHVSGEIIKVKT